MPSCLAMAAPFLNGAAIMPPHLPTVPVMVPVSLWTAPPILPMTPAPSSMAMSALTHPARNLLNPLVIGPLIAPARLPNAPANPVALSLPASKSRNPILNRANMLWFAMASALACVSASF